MESNQQRTKFRSWCTKFSGLSQNLQLMTSIGFVSSTDTPFESLQSFLSLQLSVSLHILSDFRSPHSTSFDYRFVLCTSGYFSSFRRCYIEVVLLGYLLLLPTFYDKSFLKTFYSNRHSKVLILAIWGIEPFLNPITQVCAPYTNCYQKQLHFICYVYSRHHNKLLYLVTPTSRYSGFSRN